MILEEIKNSKEYRGQIYKGFKFKHRSESTFDLSKINEIDRKLVRIDVRLEFSDKTIYIQREK